MGFQRAGRDLVMENKKRNIGNGGENIGMHTHTHTHTHTHPHTHTDFKAIYGRLKKNTKTHAEGLEGCKHFQQG